MQTISCHHRRGTGSARHLTILGLFSLLDLAGLPGGFTYPGQIRLFFGGGNHLYLVLQAVINIAVVTVTIGYRNYPALDSGGTSLWITLVHGCFVEYFPGKTAEVLFA